jgi:hypothetical protein
LFKEFCFHLGEIGPCTVSPSRQQGVAALELRRTWCGAAVEVPAWRHQSLSAPVNRRGGTTWIHAGAWGAWHGGTATSHEWGSAPATASHGMEAEGWFTG